MSRSGENQVLGIVTSLFYTKKGGGGRKERKRLEKIKGWMGEQEGNSVRREMRGQECPKGQRNRFVTGSEGCWFRSPCSLENPGKGSE